MGLTSRRKLADSAALTFAAVQAVAIPMQIASASRIVDRYPAINSPPYDCFHLVYSFSLAAHARGVSQRPYHHLAAVLFVGGPAAGKFELWLDEAGLQ